MADANNPEKPTAVADGSESPTTARPIDFDDEQQETGIVDKEGTTLPSQPSTPLQRGASRNVRFEEEAPPAKPPRPISPTQQNESTLIEAFPSIDAKVVKAVLVASGGQVEPAFNALLGMSDPSFVEEAPPTRPPRPTAEQLQLEQDELYARQLAEHYNSSGRGQPTQSRGQRVPDSSVEPERKEYSFFDDELPEIQKNIKQGFMTTQSKVNKWISNFQKRLDGDESDDEAVAGQGSVGQRQNFGSSQSDQLHGIRRQAEADRQRRSVDRNRYDADPEVISDNFVALELHDDEEAPPPKPARPIANADLFKATPPPPQSGPVDEVDALYRQPTPSNAQSATKSKKWQPLTSVAPNPEADDDPFSLGDSDDEREAKTKDINAEATERLKRAASESEGKANDNEAADGKKTLEAQERSGSLGTKNADAEKILNP